MEIKSVFSWYNLDTVTTELLEVEVYRSNGKFFFLKQHHDSREEALECLRAFLTEENKWNYLSVNFHLVETFTFTA